MCDDETSLTICVAGNVQISRCVNETDSSHGQSQTLIL